MKKVERGEYYCLRVVSKGLQGWTRNGQSRPPFPRTVSRIKVRLLDFNKSGDVLVEEEYIRWDKDMLKKNKTATTKVRHFWAKRSAILATWSDWESLPKFIENGELKLAPPTEAAML